MSAGTLAPSTALSRTAALVHRQRPGTLLSDAVLRDVPAVGPAFPSGHAVVVRGTLVLLSPHLLRAGRAVGVGLALLVGLSRIYLGAHAPLDVAGGAGAGVAIGAALALAGRRPLHTCVSSTSTVPGA